MKAPDPERLKQIRQQARLTQSDLAERAGVARPTIAQIEAGQRSCPSHVIEAYKTLISKAS